MNLQTLGYIFQGPWRTLWLENHTQSLSWRARNPAALRSVPTGPTGVPQLSPLSIPSYEQPPPSRALCLCTCRSGQPVRIHLSWMDALTQLRPVPPLCHVQKPQFPWIHGVPGTPAPVPTCTQPLFWATWVQGELNHVMNLRTGSISADWHRAPPSASGRSLCMSGVRGVLEPMKPRNPWPPSRYCTWGYCHGPFCFSCLPLP